jgi:ribosomal protein S18 acetylase RimI-like enzyme
MKKDSPISFLVRPMLAQDLTAVAMLHRRVFSDSFLTHLETRFIKRYYGEFVGSVGAYGFVATNDEAVLGFVVGVTDLARFYRYYYRRNFGTIALIVCARFLADPMIRQNIASRIHHIRYALSSLAGHRRAMFKTASPITTRLLSIGVGPEFRGSGIADALVHGLCERLRQDGVEQVGLSVRADNDRAVGFYEKTGWVHERVADGVIYLYRSTAQESNR